MRFDSDFGQTSNTDAPKLETDLERFWGALAHCDHFVLFHPFWWGGIAREAQGAV
jgi:putative NADPH-quinone reductase